MNSNTHTTPFNQAKPPLLKGTFELFWISVKNLVAISAIFVLVFSAIEYIAIQSFSMPLGSSLGTVDHLRNGYYDMFFISLISAPHFDSLFEFLFIGLADFKYVLLWTLEFILIRWYVRIVFALFKRLSEDTFQNQFALVMDSYDLALRRTTIIQFLYMLALYGLQYLSAFIVGPPGLFDDILAILITLVGLVLIGKLVLSEAIVVYEKKGILKAFAQSANVISFGRSFLYQVIVGILMVLITVVPAILLYIFLQLGFTNFRFIETPVIVLTAALFYQLASSFATIIYMHRVENHELYDVESDHEEDHLITESEI